MDRDTFFFSSLMSMILASTTWPTSSSSSGFAIAVISDLRNVDQAVNARYDLSECAERHELEDLTSSNRADVVLGLEYVPRIVLLALVAEGDLLVFLIQTDTNTFTLSPTETTSDGCLMRPQDSSEM